MFLNQINPPVMGEELKRWAEIRFQEQYSIALMKTIADWQNYTNHYAQSVLLYNAYDEPKPSKLWQRIKGLFK